MAVVRSSLWCIWLSVSVLRPAASEEQKSMAGDDVTLTCHAPNKNPIIVAEWSRNDLGTEYVLMFRDRRIDASNQHPSFKNRVDLKDRQMKDGDVSVILKNVTAADNGTYECRVKTGANRRKRANLKTAPISIIYLSVDPPGPSGGTTEDGGKEDGGKEEGGKENGGKEHGSVGLIVGVSIVASIVALVAVAVYRNHKLIHNSYHSPKPQPF